MRNFSKYLVVLFGLVAMSGGALAQGTPKPKTRGDQNKLTRVELDEAGAAIVTADDAVRLLRPRWLSPPLGMSASSNMTGGGGGATTVVVYVDDIRQPDLESLRRVRGADIQEMKYLDQNRAVQEHGPGHEAGVIEVTTVHKRP